MAGAFITATGTGVGKTHVACSLIGHWRAQGRVVRALKPVISGFDPGAAVDSDSGHLLRTLGQEVTPDAIAAISPWRFAAPLSPDMAAAREDRAIPYDQLVAFCGAAADEARADGADLIVEGVGGAMVPLDGAHTVLDWMAALDVPALLVAGSYLGTISHTLTAVSALRGRGVAIAGIVVSESEGPEHPPLDETAAVIVRHSGGAKVVVLRRAGAPPEDQVDAIAALIDGRI